MTTVDQYRSQILAELTTSLQTIQPEEIDRLKKTLHQANRIFVAGKGRSGLQMRAFAMRLMHLNRHVFVVDDVTTPGIIQGDLLLIGSGSGRTPSLIEYAHRAKGQQAKLALITGNDQSPIAAQADVMVRIAASNPKSERKDHPASILPMGSRFEHTLGLLCEMITLQLMDDLNMTSDEMFTRHANLE